MTIDTGDETTGFRLPSFPEFDVPMTFADKVFDPRAAPRLLAFDLFSLDGVLGDKFLVNGKVQPFFQVKPRRYRFRLLNTGPSRFYEFFLTDRIISVRATHSGWWPTMATFCRQAGAGREHAHWCGRTYGSGYRLQPVRG